jgi:hypothetical protein
LIVRDEAFARVWLPLVLADPDQQAVPSNAMRIQEFRVFDDLLINSEWGMDYLSLVSLFMKKLRFLLFMRSTSLKVAVGPLFLDFLSEGDPMMSYIYSI